MACSLSASPREPSFDEAQAWWSKMRRPVTFTGVPGHPCQATVLWNTGLLFSPLLYARPLDSLALRFSGPPGLMRELEGHELDALQIEFSFGQAFHFPDRMDGTTAEVRQELHDGRMPVVLSHLQHDRVQWTCSAFCRLARGHQAKSGNEDLLTEVRWSAHNPTSAPLPAQLACHLAAPHVTLGYKVALNEQALPYQRVLHWEAPVLLDDRGKARLAAAAEGLAEVAFHRSLPEETLRQSECPLAEWRLAQDVLVFRGEVPPGEHVSMRLIIPFFAVEPRALERAAAITFDQALRRVQGYWRREFARGGSIHTPEEVVNDCFDAYLSQAMLAAGRKPRSGHWILKTSPNNYEGLWGAHASIAAFSLDLRGKHSLSRGVYETFLASQGPVPDSILDLFGERSVGKSEGFSSHPGFLGNIEGFMAVLWAFYHGWTMWAIGEHARLSNDWSWFRQHVDKLVLACEWIAEQRKRTKLRDASGEKVLSYGLLPAANAFDWGFGHMFWSDAHTYRGLREIAQCLERTGHPRAPEFLSEAEQYRDDIIASVTRCREASPPVPLEDGSSIPFVPMSVEMRDYFAPDWTYVACGPLHLAWAGVVPCDHELIEQTLAFLEAGRPLGRWDGERQNYQGWDWAPRTPVDEDFSEATRPAQGRCFFWRHKMTYEPGWIPQAFVFMGRDDMPALLEHFYSLISNGGQHAHLRSPVEQRDGVAWTQPGQASLLWLMRDMLVREEGGRLLLAPSCPRAWLAPRKRIAARGLPTHFGPVTYHVEAHLNQPKVMGRVLLDELRQTPEAVLLRLRRPDGALPRVVTINGQLTGQRESEWVTLPVGESLVEVQYAS